MDCYQLLFAIGAIVLAIYYYHTSIYNYWKNRGIPGPNPGLFFGNFWDIVSRKYAVSAAVRKWYHEFKHEPVFGIYEGRTPLLVINDLDLVKDVLIRDFSSFMDRGFPVFEKIEPLAQHLFFLESERSRPLRLKISPLFTSGKLKEMFPLIVECAGNLEKFLDRVADSGEPVECREMSAKFTTDVIGSCVFGISMNALDDENSEFRRMGRRIFSDFKPRARDVGRQLAPWMIKVFGRFVQSKEIDNFFIGLVRDTMKYREKNNIYKPDMINMLMELKKHPDKVNTIELTDTLLTAQASGFFAAGFETTSSTMGHALYELAQNQDVQDKLRKEIRDVYEKNGGTLTYADIKEMKYLDKVFKGARFAYVQSKVGLTTILRDHKVDVCEKTTIPYEPDERAFLLTLKDGVNLEISKVPC